MALPVPSPSLRHPSVTVLAVLAVLAAIYAGRGFLLPIFLAAFLAIVLHPLVRRLRLWGVPESAGAALVVLAFIAVTAAVLYGLAAPLDHWANRLPNLLVELRTRLAAVRDSIAQMQQMAATLEGMTSGGEGDAPAQGDGGADVVGVVLSRTRSVAVTLLTTVVLLYFMLAEGSRVSDRVIASLPADWYAETGSAMIADLRQQITAYLRTFALINVGLGIVTWLAMALLGLPSAALWGLMAGLLNFLPFVGPLVTLTVITGVAVLSATTWFDLLAPPLVYAVINTAEGSLVSPKLLGRQLTLNPIAIFIAVLFWTWAWGPVGALIAVPVLAVVRIAAEYLRPAQGLLPFLR